MHIEFAKLPTITQGRQIIPNLINLEKIRKERPRPYLQSTIQVLHKSNRPPHKDMMQHT